MVRPLLTLHIGAPKTGTTFLQSYCVLSHERLAENGILYPETGRENVAHHRLAWSVTPHGPSFDAELLFAALKDEVDQIKPAQVLISSEVWFLDTDVERLSDLLSWADVTVVVYLRRQDVWFSSMIKQYIKEDRYRSTSYTSPTEQRDILKRHLDYGFILDRWGECFGHDRLRTASYDRIEKEGGLLVDFMSKLGLTTYQDWPVPTDPGGINISLKSAELELVRLSNSIETASEGRSRWLYHLPGLADRLDTTMNEPNILPEGSGVVSFASRYADGNRIVADLYGDGRPFFGVPDQQAAHIAEGEPGLSVPDLAAVASIDFIEVKRLADMLGYRVARAKGVGFNISSAADNLPPVPAVLFVDEAANASEAAAASLLSARIAIGTAQLGQASVGPFATSSSAGEVRRCRNNEELRYFLAEAAKKDGLLVLGVAVIVAWEIRELARQGNYGAIIFTTESGTAIRVWLPAGTCRAVCEGLADVEDGRVAEPVAGGQLAEMTGAVIDRIPHPRRFTWHDVTGPKPELGDGSADDITFARDPCRGLLSTNRPDAIPAGQGRPCPAKSARKVRDCSVMRQARGKVGLDDKGASIRAASRPIRLPGVGVNCRRSGRTALRFN